MKNKARSTEGHVKPQTRQERQKTIDSLSSYRHCIQRTVTPTTTKEINAMHAEEAENLIRFLGELRMIAAKPPVGILGAMERQRGLINGSARSVGLPEPIELKTRMDGRYKEFHYYLRCVDSPWDDMNLAILSITVIHGKLCLPTVQRASMAAIREHIRPWLDKCRRVVAGAEQPPGGRDAPPVKENQLTPRKLEVLRAFYQAKPPAIGLSSLMKIASTAGAIGDHRTLIQSVEIGKGEDDNFLRRLCRGLKTDNYLESMRGPLGGYWLTEKGIKAVTNK